MGGYMFKKITLDNGLRIVCEEIPYVRSVSVGIWIGTGSRNEDKSNNGISHFIEHMLFKGTKNRDAREIAACIDNIGGQLNAFTGKECTCYYTKTLDNHIDIAVEVLADMFFNSLFAKKDMDVEKKVIAEEIGMYEDTPEELVHDIISESVWSDNPLGYPILGTQECLSKINKNTLSNYMMHNYTAGNVVIAVAGNFEEKKLLSLLNKYFGHWNSESINTTEYGKVGFNISNRIKEKDTEQVHICLGFEGIEQGNDDLYSLLAVNNIFGGGASSSLFQKIREEKGLVYSIYSFPSAYKNAGMFSIYAGMNPVHLENVIKLIIEEVRLLKREGISSKDLDMSKEQLKGNYILGLESTSSRMNSIGKSELMQGYILTPEEVLQKIDDINLDRASDVIDRVFDISRMSFSAVGNIKSDFDYKTLIKY
jgi:predicted Zn-dependent peptidase